MRISTGVTVNVSANTERWLSEIRAGRAFVRGVGVTGVAAQFSHVQLFNPVASGITIIVRSLWVSVVAVAEVRLTTHNTALPTLAGNGVNLLLGGSGGLGEIRTTTNVADQGTMVRQLPVLANSPLSLVPEWYFELSAGEGICCISELVNTTFYGNFDWLEVS